MHIQYSWKKLALALYYLAGKATVGLVFRNLYNDIKQVYLRGNQDVLLRKDESFIDPEFIFISRNTILAAFETQVNNVKPLQP